MAWTGIPGGRFSKADTGIFAGLASHILCDAKIHNILRQQGDSIPEMVLKFDEFGFI
jgi:hypothetical protein